MGPGEESVPADHGHHGDKEDGASGNGDTEDRSQEHPVNYISYQRRFLLQINFLKSVPLLSALPGVVLARLGDVLETEMFTCEEHIVREGTVGDTFYILASGVVRVTIRGELIREMGQGEYFGEQVTGVYL